MKALLKNLLFLICKKANRQKLAHQFAIIEQLQRLKKLNSYHLNLLLKKGMKLKVIKIEEGETLAKGTQLYFYY